MSKTYHAIIIGGSYAGLSAAMSLGRVRREVLVIDSGLPCNRQTPHSHNFLTRDGETPSAISAIAREQVGRYKTVTFLDALATSANPTNKGFSVVTNGGETFETTKLILATGLTDILPEVEGLSDCWGITVIHCPYCHGYEARGQKTAILGQGNAAQHYAKLIRKLTDDVTILTDGPAAFTVDQCEVLEKNRVPVIEKPIARLDHQNGKLQKVIFHDGSSLDVTALYVGPTTEQHSNIPIDLGCELTESGHILVDNLQKTSVEGVFACGDNSSQLRSVAQAVFSGTMAGARVHYELSEEEFG